jgi:hypothetical protein
MDAVFRLCLPLSLGIICRHPPNEGCAGARSAVVLNAMLSNPPRTPPAPIPAHDRCPSRHLCFPEILGSAAVPNRHIHPRRSSGQRNLRPDLRKALAFFETGLRTLDRAWRQFGRVGISPARDGSKRMSPLKLSPSNLNRKAEAWGKQVTILPARGAQHAT